MRMRLSTWLMLASAVGMFLSGEALGQGRGNRYSGGGNPGGGQPSGQYQSGGSSTRISVGLGGPNGGFNYSYRDGGSYHGSSSRVGVGVYVPVGPVDLGYSYSSGGHYSGSSYGARVRFYDNDDRYYYRDGYYYDGPRYVVPSETIVESAVVTSTPVVTSSSSPAVGRETQPPLPTADDLAWMSEEQLKQVLLGGARSFQNEIEASENGNTWVEYFSLPLLKKQLEQDAAGDKSASESLAGDALREIAARMASASSSPQYETVTRRWGFKLMLATLPEYLKPAKARRWNQLQMATKEFATTLDGNEQGPGWKKYLRIDSLAQATAGGEPSGAELSQLRETLGLFDQVAKDEQYKPVVRLTGFVPVHVGLQRYLAAAPKPAETLPPPPAAK